MNPVNVLTWSPKVIITIKLDLSEPWLDRFRTILGIELTSVDQNFTLGLDKLTYEMRVVDHLVTIECLTDSARAHLKYRCLGAITHTDGIIDGLECRFILIAEIVDYRVFMLVPICSEDALVVGKDISTHIFNVVHDSAAYAVCLVIVTHETLLAVLSQSCNLWHI